MCTHACTRATKITATRPYPRVAARKVYDAYRDTLDQRLQKQFQVKLLGISIKCRGFRSSLQRLGGRRQRRYRY